MAHPSFTKRIPDLLLRFRFVEFCDKPYDRELNKKIHSDDFQLE